MHRLVKKSSWITSLVFILIFGLSSTAFAITWTPGFTSSSHTVSSTSTNPEVTVSWTAMTPTTGNSVGSYTYVWDSAASTSIEATVTPSGTYSGNVSATTVTTTLVTGTWYLHMRAVDSGGDWTTTQHFGPIIIDTQPDPTITAISPASGTNTSSTVNVIITGTNFKKTDNSDFTTLTVSIGSTALTNVSATNATTITGTYAILNKTAGTKTITVTTGYGTRTTSSVLFTVANAAPTVTAVNPTSGSNGASRTVTITGTGFLSTATTPAASGNPTVQMRDPATPANNFNLTNISVVSKTSITATVPSGETVGTYDIVVTNADGQSGTGTDLYQVKYPAPTITDVSPSSGANDANRTITITGTNFLTSGTTVVTLEHDTLDNITCGSVSVSSATSLTASVPSGSAVGTYDVRVTNPDAQTAMDPAAFSVTNPVAAITSISPSSMTNDSSQAVTITGTKFRSGATVKIGTTSCTGVTVSSATTITCTVPANITAGTYNVTVTNPGATAGSLTNGFTVNAASATAAISLSASDASSVPAGDLTITATFNISQAGAPTISIDTQGTDAVADADMTATADDTIWTYVYTVGVADAGTYVDGAATITVKTSGGTIVATSGNDTFTIDTVALSAAITYDQYGNTTGPFLADVLTITATFNSAPTNPVISINQPGSTDISLDPMSGTGTTYTYDYTIVETDGSTYRDGTATVTLSDDSGAIAIGNGGTFGIDTTQPTVALTYNQGGITSGSFIEGSLVITATFSEAPAGTPQIAIDQPGTTDVTATDMTQSTSRIFTYTYTIHPSTDGGYDDGDATVTITNGADAAGNDNTAATNSTFTIVTEYTCFITTAGSELSYMKSLVLMIMLIFSSLLIYLCRKALRAGK